MDNNQNIWGESSPPMNAFDLGVYDQHSGSELPISTFQWETSDSFSDPNFEQSLEYGEIHSLSNIDLSQADTTWLVDRISPILNNFSAIDNTAICADELSSVHFPLGNMDNLENMLMTPLEQSPQSPQWDSGSASSLSFSPNLFYSQVEPLHENNTDWKHEPSSGITPIPELATNFPLSCPPNAKAQENHHAHESQVHFLPETRSGKDTSYSCLICHKTHGSERDLNRHYVTNHRFKAEKMGLDIHKIPCKYCDKDFSRQDNLLRHLSRKHGRSPVRRVIKVKTGLP